MTNSQKGSQSSQSHSTKNNCEQVLKVEYSKSITVTVPANSEEDVEGGEGEHDNEADDLSGAAAESDERDCDAAKGKG